MSDERLFDGEPVLNKRTRYEDSDGTPKEAEIVTGKGSSGWWLSRIYYGLPNDRRELRQRNGETGAEVFLFGEHASSPQRAEEAAVEKLKGWLKATGRRLPLDN